MRLRRRAARWLVVGYADYRTTPRLVLLTRSRYKWWGVVQCITWKWLLHPAGRARVLYDPDGWLQRDLELAAKTSWEEPSST